MTKDQSVRAQVAAWQSKLIELNKRNPLYCLPANNRGLLPLSHVPPDHLYRHLQSSRRQVLLTLIDPEQSANGNGPTKAQELALVEEDFKKVSSLRLRASSSLREQGLNTLYIAFGYLDWTDPASREVIRSPLVLLPVHLERLADTNSIRLSRSDDEAEVNPTLVYRLAQHDVRVSLPLVTDGDELILSDYFAAVASCISSHGGWTISEAAFLGRFSFLKMAMYRDLERQMDRACENPVIQALSGDPESLFKLPAVKLPSLAELDTVLNEEKDNCVLDADPSQQRAILAAKRGQSFVLQGPPGTGKTQTIANIIAECISSGRRVLFVSQKMAALNAVFKRLRDRGLHAHCLEAHSHKASKKAIVEQLRKAYENRPRPAESSQSDVARLTDLRGRLSEVAEALHTRRQPLGISVFEANGEVASAVDIPDLNYSFVDPHQISDAQLRLMEELAQRLACHHDLFHQAYTHPWRGAKAERCSSEFLGRVRAVFGDLLGIVTEWNQKASQLSDLSGFAAAKTLADADRAVSIATLLARTPHPLISWFEKDALPATIQTASRAGAEHRAYLADEASLSAQWSSDMLDLPLQEVRDRLVSRHSPTLLPLLGQTWQDTSGTRHDELRLAIDQAVAAAKQLTGTLAEMTNRAGLTNSPTFSHSRYVLKIAEIAAMDIRPVRAWFNQDTLSAYQQQTSEAEQAFQTFLAARSELLQIYSESIFQIDLESLDRRFTNDYASVLRYLKPAYYRDKRTLRQCVKEGNRLRGRDIGADLHKAHEVAKRQNWITSHDAFFRSSFGNHYNGLSTEWGSVLEYLQRQRDLLNLLPAGQASEQLVHLMCSSGSEIAAWQELTEQLRLQVSRFEAGLRTLSQLCSISTVPFSSLPISQVSMPDLVVWLIEVAAALDDYYAARTTVARCSRGPKPPTASDLVSALELAGRVLAQKSAIERASDHLNQLFGPFYSGLKTDWESVQAALQWTNDLVIASGVSPPAALIKVAATAGPAQEADITAVGQSLSTTTRTLINRLDILSEFFPTERLYVGEVPVALLPCDEIANWLSIRLQLVSELERWIDFQGLSQEFERVGLLSFYETTIHVQPAEKNVVLGFRKRFYQLWIDYICDNIPVLRHFRGDHHAQLIAEFQDRDLSQIAGAPQRIGAEVMKRRPTREVNIGQMGALRKLLASRRLKPIRKILADIPDVLFQYKPCLLMSPLSVSLFLEAESFRFDVVIFDEASQVFIEDALCSILRADQVIVAGDTKQLPPTSFFKTLDDGAPDDDEEDERYESILQAAGVLAGNPAYEDNFTEHELCWHYRSRHESLIAFSKENFYRRITAFPAPTAKSAVSFVHVPGGIYYPGANRRHNPVEANEVVRQVIEHAQNHPDRSIGVITFNEPQKSLIEDILAQRFHDEPDLARLLNEEGTEGFFVKNIENVQGDERDVIFLSIGFARTPDRALSMSFGPLNLEGGERRLNVAVTRARERMIVVSSILPGEIDLARTDKEGPRLLKAYLTYAQSGASLLQDVEFDQSKFETAVERAVNLAGYQTRRRVGRLGYEVSIGVLHPERSSNYLLGIQCDGLNYRDAETVRARDRLRDEVLTRLGWQLRRVWSSDWVRNPARELDCIVEAIQVALHPQKQAAHPAPIMRTVEGDGSVDDPSETITSLFHYSPPEPEEDNKVKVEALPSTLLSNEAIPGTTFYEPICFVFEGNREDFYSDYRSAAKARQDLMLAIVEQEGPLPLEVAIQKMAEAAGISRVGARVREIIEDTIETLTGSEQIESRDDFLYRKGIACYPARIARNGDPPRPIEHISPEEIGEAAIALLKVSFGMRRDELILEVARLFGYRSTSVNIRDRISEAISMLELDNRIHVMGGQIRALELAG